MATGRTANLTSSHAYIIDSPMQQWKITHGLGYNPTVQTTVKGADGKMSVWLAKEVSYPDVNTVIIEWSEPRMGEVRLS